MKVIICFPHPSIKVIPTDRFYTRITIKSSKLKKLYSSQNGHISKMSRVYIV